MQLEGQINFQIIYYYVESHIANRFAKAFSRILEKKGGLASLLKPLGLLIGGIKGTWKHYGSQPVSRDGFIISTKEVLTKGKT